MTARSDHSDRDRAERIKRLRQRLRHSDLSTGDLAAIIQGILDLLADEL